MGHLRLAVPILRVTAVTFTIALLAGAGVSGAAASTAGNYPSGYDDRTFPTSHEFIASWDSSARTIYLESDAGSTLGSGHCADAWFDWQTAGGDHYDARLSRNCRPGTSRIAASSYSGYQEHNNSVTFTGVQKLSGCVYYQPPGDGRLHGCVQSAYAYNSVESVNPSRPNNVTYFWVRLADGSLTYNTGGDPTSFSS